MNTQSVKINSCLFILGLAVLAFFSGCAVLAKRALPAEQIRLASPEESLWAFCAGLWADQNGEFSKGAEFYQKALVNNPEAVSVRLYLVRDLIRLERFQDAQREYRLLLEKKPEDRETRFMVAQLFDAVGDTAVAAVLYQDVIRMGRQTSGPFTKLGILLLKMDKHQEAVRQLKEALEIDPTDPDARLALIRYYQMQNQTPQVIAELEKAIAASLQTEEWLTILAQVYNDTGQDSKADEVYQQLLQVDPHSSAALHALALSALHRQQWAEAISYLEKTLRIRPDDDFAQRNLGLALFKLGKYDEARSQLLPLTDKRKSQDALTHFILGAIYYEKKLPYLAVDEFRETIRLDSDMTDAYLGLGRALSRTQQFSEAVRVLQEASARFSKNSEVLFQYGLSLLRSRDPQAALKVFDQTLVLNPRQATVYLYQGQAYLDLNRFNDAVIAWKQALVLDGTLADAYNYLGYTYADRGLDLSQAVRWLKKALAIEPENGYYLDSFAWALYRQGKYELALKTVLTARELLLKQNLPVDPEITNHLAEILFKLRRYPEAEQVWQQMLKDDPDNSELKSKLNKLPVREDKP